MRRGERKIRREDSLSRLNEYFRKKKKSERHYKWKKMWNCKLEFFLFLQFSLLWCEGKKIFFFFFKKKKELKERKTSNELTWSASLHKHLQNIEISEFSTIPCMDTATFDTTSRRNFGSLDNLITAFLRSLRNVYKHLKLLLHVVKRLLYPRISLRCFTSCPE